MDGAHEDYDFAVVDPGGMSPGVAGFSPSCAPSLLFRVYGTTTLQKCEAVPRRARIEGMMAWLCWTLGACLRGSLGSHLRTPPLHCSGFTEQLFYGDVKRFRGGLVFKAHRILYH